MKSIGRAFLWFLCLPFNAAIGFPFVLALTTPRTWRWDRGILLGVWRPWIAARWRYSTTLGHGHGRHERHLTGHIDAHERLHTRQGEDAAILAWLIAGLILGVCGLDEWPLAIGFLALSYALLAVHFVGAFLRGGDVYRDALHEVAAYAATDTIEAQHAGRTWLDVYEERAGRQ